MNRTILIRGETAEAALAAAYLGVRLGPAFAIHWQRGDPAIHAPMRCGPVIRELLAELEMAEADIIAGGGGYLLGTAVALSGRPSLFLGHGDHGAAIGGTPFTQFLAAAGDAAPPAQAFNVAALLAAQGRFRPPADDPTSPASLFTYGLMASGEQWMSAMAERAVSDGVRIGSKPEGDPVLVIDTVPRHDLDWQTHPAGELAVVEGEASHDRQPPFAHAAVSEEKVETFWPLRGKVWRRTIGLGLEGARLGRAMTPWRGNTLLIGQAAVRTTDILPLGFDLLVNQLRHLVDLAPAGSTIEHEAAEYNRRTTLEAERALDVDAALLHGSFALTPTDELQRKFDQFDHRGRVPLEDGDLLSEEEWGVILRHLRGAPGTVDVRASAIPAAERDTLLQKMHAQMQSVAAQAPAHEAYLASMEAAS